MQNRIGHPALPEALLDRPFRGLERKVALDARERNQDELRHAGGRGGVDEAQLSLPIDALDGISVLPRNRRRGGRNDSTRAATRGVERCPILQVTAHAFGAHALEMRDSFRVGRSPDQRANRLPSLGQEATDVPAQEAGGARDENHGASFIHTLLEAAVPGEVLIVWAGTRRRQ